MRIPLDAVPDITNNQVQIVTTAPTLAAQEVEQYISYPIEAVMANIPDVQEVRSISRYGLSLVTVVFDDDVEIMKSRQFVGEQLRLAESGLPSESDRPEMMPITTGLGEIYQYVLVQKDASLKKYSLMELRTIQDWIVKRQLTGIPGIIEVSSFGGELKQYEVAIQSERMIPLDVSWNEVLTALEENNANSGGSYIEQGGNAFYIRTEGRVQSIADIENIEIKTNNRVPIRIKDIAQVGFGSPKRYGAMTMDGMGEVVGGITLMLKGANSSQTIDLVKERIDEIQNSLPEGVEIYPYLDRSELVAKTIGTVTKNLIEGGLIVIFVLILLLGNFRAGMIVASVIPLSMLFALTLMNLLGVSANLMSLGAIDFGIVVDGAVIIVEGVLHHLHKNNTGTKLLPSERDEAVKTAASTIYRSAAFGVLIILVVFVPIFTLEGIEGRMFLPMAQTVTFAILGALVLSLTYVPAISATILRQPSSSKKTLADRIMDFLGRVYHKSLNLALGHSTAVLVFAGLGLVGSIFLFNRLGAEFVPTLEEGDLAMQLSIEPGSSLTKSIETSSKVEAILLANFPEIEHVVSKIGTAEVPTDPMAIEDADVMIILKERDEWTSASSRGELIDKMKNALNSLEDASFEFTQPIQLRFNELMTGAKSDIAVKIFGEDSDKLREIGEKAEEIIAQIPGAGDVKLERTEGLRQVIIEADRQKMAIQGVSSAEINRVIRTCYGGYTTGAVYENERRFDLVARLAASERNTIDAGRIFVSSSNGNQVPLSSVARVYDKEGPMMITRENARRRISIGVNVRDRDVASLVGEIRQQLDDHISLPPGYSLKIGGQFENLQHAVDRLALAVPVSMFLILFLLYLAFQSTRESIMIFIAVPLGAIGGILALWLRDMPFSISAGVGFIALFGVAVLNGIVMMTEFKRLRLIRPDLKELLLEATGTRLRPVLITALVASLGFLPMAISGSNGAEVQRPLATVVIGGLITSTLLTMLVLPTIYYVVEKRRFNKKSTDA